MVVRAEAEREQSAERGAGPEERLDRGRWRIATLQPRHHRLRQSSVSGQGALGQLRITPTSAQVPTDCEDMDMGMLRLSPLEVDLESICHRPSSGTGLPSF